MIVLFLLHGEGQRQGGQGEAAARLQNQAFSPAVVFDDPFAPHRPPVEDQVIEFAPAAAPAHLDCQPGGREAVSYTHLDVYKRQK